MTDALDWTERGRELSTALDACHAVVVVGDDPVATAEVALGIARVQAARRRVAIADLIGQVAPLQSLIADDEDPHGIADSFEFGVSLNRITRAVADSGQLFVMPSGSIQIEHEQLLPNPRWKRLSGGFRRDGALLLLVAPADAARLKDLVAATDGVVLVGDAVPADITVAQSLAWLRTKKTSRPSLAGGAVAPLVVIEEARAKPLRERKRIVGAAAGIALVFALAAVGVWIVRRPFVRDHPVRGVWPTTPAAPAASAILGVDSAALLRADSARFDSLARASVPESMVVAASSAPLNPADSSRASSWAVVLGPTATPAGAILNLRGRFEAVPAGTYGFDSRARTYWLVAGAYTTQAAADSLLAQLRERKILAAGTGSVTKLPFAFLVQADVPASDVRARLSNLAGKGKPVYALKQANGSANLYFGAYESAREAALAEPTVREAGLTPTLVYRIGRVF